MKIILNCIGLSKGGGLTEGINLVRAIPAFAPDDTFLAVVPAGCGYEEIDLPPNCEMQIFPIKRFNAIWRIWFDNIKLPNIVRDMDADSILTLCNNGPVFPRGFHHDVFVHNAFLVYPVRDWGGYKPAFLMKFLILRFLLGLSLRSARNVFVQSQVMCDQLQQRYRAKAPVTLVGRTIENLPEQTTAVQDKVLSEQQARISSLSGFRLLYLTCYYPHKNIDRAIQAVQSRRAAGDDVTLVLTIGAEEGRFAQKINSGVYGDAVLNIGPVQRAHIAQIYQLCDAALCSSLMETVPGAVLEAFGHKKPLLISDLPYARENCGDAALYFDPHNTQDIAGAIQKLMENPDLGAELVARGDTQYQAFDFERDKMAQKFLDGIKTG